MRIMMKTRMRLGTMARTADLGALPLGARPAEDLDDPGEGDAGLVHADALLCNTDNPSDPP